MKTNRQTYYYYYYYYYYNKMYKASLWCREWYTNIRWTALLCVCALTRSLPPPCCVCNQRVCPTRPSYSPTRNSWSWRGPSSVSCLTVTSTTLWGTSDLQAGCKSINLSSVPVVDEGQRELSQRALLVFCALLCYVYVLWHSWIITFIFIIVWCQSSSILVSKRHMSRRNLATF